MFGHDSPRTTILKGWSILVVVTLVSLLLSSCTGAQQAKKYHGDIVFSQSGVGVAAL